MRDAKGLFEQILLFLLVASLETRGHGGAGVAARVQDVAAVVVFRLVEQSLNARLDE